MLNELIAWLPLAVGTWLLFCAGAWLIDDVLPRHPKLQKLLDKLFKTNQAVQSVENITRVPNITYRVGERVYPDSFDENRWNECSHGIHFFVDKESAIHY